MTYEEYLDLLDEEDTQDNAVNYLNMGGQDVEAGKAAMADIGDDFIETEEFIKYG